VLADHQPGASLDAVDLAARLSSPGSGAAQADLFDDLPPPAAALPRAAAPVQALPAAAQAASPRAIPPSPAPPPAAATVLAAAAAPGRSLAWA
jgi:hypothetical protein